MNKQIRDEIMRVSHPEGAYFQARIVNSNYPVIGSRMGEMRKLAKSLAKTVDLSIQDPDVSYEEVLIRGLIIAYQKGSILDKTELIEQYLKLVDTWALVDSFCSTFKIRHNEKEKLLEILSSYLKRGDEFLIRYALIMLLSHYVRYNRNGEKLSRPRKLKLSDLEVEGEDSYDEIILNLINQEYKSYYDSMGAAWVIAELFLFSPKRTLEFLKNNNLDIITHNRAIDKIRQSKQPDSDVKKLIKDLKRP